MSTRQVFAAALLVSLVPQVRAQLTVDNTLTPLQLLEEVLLGEGVTASNVTFNGVASTIVNEQAGRFFGTNSNIGLDSGLVLATGAVSVVQGPNTSGSNTIGGGNDGFGDPDLSELNDLQTNDAAILEFDFVPSGDTLFFRYVFSSEEYNEYVCSDVNDAFGFFLSGPGISGPFTNNAINLALVPGTNVPVTINTINNGTAGSNGQAALCAVLDPNWTANSVYYTDNTGGSTVESDGFTVVLVASASVQCGATYHIKLAIADGGDTGFDSGVFLESGSFSSSVVPAPLSANTTTQDGIVDETCEGGCFTVFRAPGSVGDAVVEFTMGGEAQNGVDYVLITGPVVVPAGQDSVQVCLDPYEDDIAEGEETVELTVYVVDVCGDTLTNSTDLIIRDYTPISIVLPEMKLDCTQDSVLLDAQIEGGYGALTYLWLTEEQQPTEDIYVSGYVDSFYGVQVWDQCIRTDSARVEVDSGCEVFVPNVMTPNGDNLNDRFEIRGLFGTQNTLKIFNRWGQMVYETRNYTGGWSAQGVSAGTYYFSLEVEDDPKSPFRGSFSILSAK
jgi:gliding motility-associated-like protein